MDKSKSKSRIPPEALAYFREQGSKGGKTRLTNLTPERRSEIARKAAQKRWGKKATKGTPQGSVGNKKGRTGK